MSSARTAALPWPDHLAAIDMGSNSFRLEIGQISPGRYKRIDYFKETVRLGAGLDAHSQLTEEAMQRGLDCLARIAQRLQGYAPAQVRAVATQTLREATNRDVFLRRAQTVLGHPIEVISGREEARLIYAGVARLQPSDRTRLVIDIGGRSTEMILGQGRTPLRAESFQVGSVSLSMRYFADGRFTEEAFRAAQVAAGAELEEALEPFAPHHWQEALGASGTVGAVSQLLQATGQSDGTVTAEGLRWCIGQCLKAGRIERLDLPGLKDDRRAVIGGGLSIVYTLLTHFGIEALQPARGALRQGVIFDLDERLHRREGSSRHDVRELSVSELQRRFEVDQAQAVRVAAVAQDLYRQMQTRSDDEAQEQEAHDELRWACALHEIGMMVSHHDHHRHSAYLLSHVDAAGFSQSQQRRLATLVLAQRGGLRKVEEALSADPDLMLRALALRLAILKCHARGAEHPGTLSVERSGHELIKINLQLPAAWAAANPRTHYLLREEVLAWDRTSLLSLRLST